MNDSPQKIRTLYLDLLKRSLLNTLYADPTQPVTTPSGRQLPAGQIWDEGGLAWLTPAHTMIGRKRLENIQFCLECVLADDIVGDVIETGVWRGGAAIFMRGILMAYGVTDRFVWVADSFEGLPPPDTANYPADTGLDLSQIAELAVSLETVQDNFSRYGLLDDQVRFLEGYFRDTLPFAPIQKLALLRLDGDLYESTIQSLTYLYPKLSPGGFVIVDDYNAIEPCKRAVHDYLETPDLSVELQPVDWTAVYWRKPQSGDQRTQ